MLQMDLEEPVLPSLSPTHPLIRRFAAVASLTEGDRNALLSALSTVRTFPPQADVIREGDEPTHAHVLVEGFACRYKIVEGGRRQIVAYLVPGDFCDTHMCMLALTDHNVLTLSDSKIAQISRDTMRTLENDHPAIMRALLWASLVDASMAREWLANIGRRSPDRRISHLLCEMLSRLKAVGLAEGGRFAFPITQADLGDAMGLSTVHVNRTLQDLKEKRLIRWRRGHFEILDVARCQHFSDFDPTYLHRLEPLAADD